METPSPERLRFRDLFNLAGALTLARVPLAFVTAFTMGDRWMFAGVLALAMLTDVLDGPVARWTGTQSRTGAVADGWADKIFLINYAWSMLMLDLVSGWHLWVWFLRELIQGITIPFVALDYALKKAAPPEPHWTGKACSMLIVTAMVAALVEVHVVRDAATVLAGLAGLASVVIYLARDRPWKRIVRKM